MRSVAAILGSSGWLLLVAVPDAGAVVIGVIDTGVSALHPDFFDESGKSRIAVLLDLTRPPRGAHPDLEALGGAAFVADEIDAIAAGRTLGDEVELPGDPEGHGTHVTSIAAAAAPAAALYVIRAGAALEDEAILVAVARAFFEWADVRGEPAVLDLSFGRAAGLRNGSSLLELAIDELTGPGLPGRVVVVAAGNDGGLASHVRAGDGGDPSVDVSPVPWPGEPFAGTRMALEIAGPAGDEIAGLVVEPPSGRSVGPVPTGALAFGRTTEATVLVEDAAGGDEVRGWYEWRVTIESTGGPLDGTWRLLLDGARGHFDVWLTDLADGAWAQLTTAGGDGDDMFSLRAPATARHAIAVAAVESPAAFIVRAPFSSVGPTLDGRPKPDLAAPGVDVLGALAPESWLARPGVDLRRSADGLHAGLSGTSAAAPQVAAAAAVILEAAPELDAAQVRALLVASAVPAPGGGWNPATGFGLLDPARALARLDAGQIDLPADMEHEAAEAARLLAAGRPVTRRDELGAAGCGIVAARPPCDRHVPAAWFLALVGANFKKSKTSS